jgi:hypothetical protein
MPKSQYFETLNELKIITTQKLASNVSWFEENKASERFREHGIT